MAGSEKKARPEREGSGFQRLLEEKGKSSGPKVLKGLPIRQRAAPKQPDSQPSHSESQPASTEPEEEARKDTTISVTCSPVSVNTREVAAPESSDSRVSQNTIEEKLHGAEDATAAAALLAERPGHEDARGPEDGKQQHEKGELHHKSLRAFWAQKATQIDAANPPRPRTPRKDTATPATSDTPQEGKASEIQDADKLRASAIEAATCDRFGNPVLSLGPKTTVGRALAAHEDFQNKRLPAFARFRDAEKSSASASQSPSHASEEGSRPFDQTPIQGDRMEPASLHQDGGKPTVQSLKQADGQDRVGKEDDSSPVSAEEKSRHHISAEQEKDNTRSPSPKRNQAEHVSSSGPGEAAKEAESPKKSAESDAQVAQGSPAMRDVDTGNDAAAEPQTRNADGDSADPESSSPQKHQDAAAEDTSASDIDQHEEEAVEAPSRKKIQDTAYREDLPDTDGVDSQVTDKSQTSKSNEVNTPQEELGKGDSSDSTEDAAVERPPTAQNRLSREHAERSKVLEPAQGREVSTGDSQAHADAKHQQTGTDKEPSLALETDVQKQDESHAELPVTSKDDKLDLIEPQAMPSREQDSSQAEDSIVDAASVSSLDLGEGTQSLEETSDAESLATGSHASTGQTSRSDPQAGKVPPLPDLISLRSAPPGESSGRGSDADPDWQSQAKHVFVLSNAGKPIFTLHGDENKLAGFMAVVHAMISFAADTGDPLRSLRAGKHVIVFLVKGPLYLVAVSSQGEPEAVLRRQLACLHSQIVCILTTGFEQMFRRNARFDSRRLLGGTQAVLSGLIHNFDILPQALLNAFPPIPLPPAVRHSCVVALQKAIKESSAVFGIMLVGDLVCAVAQTRPHVLAQGDLLVLCNFIASSESFLQAPESFTPVCLPAFNPSAFLHAYVQYLDKDARLCLTLLSAKQDSFFELAKAGRNLSKSLSVQLAEIGKLAKARGYGGRYRITDLPATAGGKQPGQTPLLHFIYKSPSRGQYVAPAWTCPLDDEPFQKAVMMAYSRMYAAMQPDAGNPTSTGRPSQRVRYAQGRTCTALGFIGSEFELYAAFDALVLKREALEICQRIASWVKANQASLFAPI